MKKVCFLKHALPLPAPLLIDKPTGVTSHDVVDWARRLTGVKKIGHAGTLDPLATGLLILLIGRSWTKRQSEFLKQDKIYEVECQFGKTSDTYDMDGKVTPTQLSQKLDAHQVETAIEHHFKGPIQQTVPPFSAIKRHGRKLYQLARAGQLKSIDLPRRSVTIKRFELLDFEQQKQQARCLVEVSSGTYVRSLIHDLGSLLKVGALVTRLRRTQIGTLKLADAFCCPLMN